MSKQTLTPNDLAERLAGKDRRDTVGKAFVRPFLRRHFTRDGGVKGSSWYLTDEQVACVTAAWKAKQEGKAFDVTAWKKARRARKPKQEAVES